jgi:hypothetical protein
MFLLFYIYNIDHVWPNTSTTANFFATFVIASHAACSFHRVYGYNYNQVIQDLKDHGPNNLLGLKNTVSILARARQTNLDP